jgi:hypothetical protein
MKLIPLKNENVNRKLKMIITETQFKRLAQYIIQLHEQNVIMNTYLVKRIKESK